MSQPEVVKQLKWTIKSRAPNFVISALIDLIQFLNSWIFVLFSILPFSDQFSFEV